MSIEHAYAQHAAEFAARCQNPGSPRVLKSHLRHFFKGTGVHYLHDLSPAVIKDYIGRGIVPAQRLRFIRNFLRFCNENYAVGLYVPETHFRHRDWQPKALRKLPQGVKAAARRVQWNEAVAKAAPRMRLPQQKVVFLLGYLYGVHLPSMTNLSINDIQVLAEPMRADFYLALTAAMNQGALNFKEPLQEWLGDSEWTARRRWKVWVNDPDARFDHIVWAGALRSLEEGAPNRAVNKFIKDMFYAVLDRPTIDVLNRMEWPFGRPE